MDNSRFQSGDSASRITTGWLAESTRPTASGGMDGRCCRALRSAAGFWDNEGSLVIRCSIPSRAPRESNQKNHMDTKISAGRNARAVLCSRCRCQASHGQLWPLRLLASAGHRTLLGKHLRCGCVTLAVRDRISRHRHLHTSLHADHNGWGAPTCTVATDDTMPIPTKSCIAARMVNTSTWAGGTLPPRSAP